MNKVYLYELRHPKTGEVRYVGITNSPRRRIQQHISNKTKFPVNDWIRKLKNNNLLPLMNVIGEYSEETISDIERAAIKRLRKSGGRLLNVSEGGESIYGLYNTPEMREKISSTLKKYWVGLASDERARILNNLVTDGSNWIGREHSEKSKKQMSESAKSRPANRKGKKNSESHRKAISDAKKGKVPSHLLDAEVQEKSRLSRTGQIRSEDTKNKIKEARAKQTFSQETQNKKRRTMRQKHVLKLWKEELEAYELLEDK